jgi:hypothetical protein
MTPKPRPPRKRGGQPFNRNALKHSIFSQFILLEEQACMDGSSKMVSRDSLAMAVVCFKKAMEERLAASDAKEKLSWDYACHYWLEAVINANARNKEYEQVMATIWDNLFDAVRAANDRQGVKR